jgi:TolA-binding protein
MNKAFRIYILFALCCTGGLAFADQPGSSLDDKPSVDTAANSNVQVPVVPSDATAASETHTSYLYDLKKLIDRSRENIKEVNERIKEQAVLKRNQKREERAHEYYEKGVELTNEGKLDEARDYFEKAIRITDHPEMAGYIKESQRRLRRQEEALHAQERQHYNQIKKDESTRKEDVETAYKEAVDLYKQKKYHPAKDAFEHVDEIAPDYRATGSYLKIIDQDIITSDALAAKQQAVEIGRQQKEAEAARAKEKSMWLAQIEEKEKEHKDSIDKQAQEVYDQAVVLYKNKKFAEAKKKFQEVSWVIPDYKATMKYLERIDRDAEQEQERVAQEQQKTLQEQRWKETVESKKREAQKQSELKVKELQRQKALQEQAQFLYTAAVSLYDKKNMDEALAKFNDIEKLSPDFKSTRTYIAKIEAGQPKKEIAASPSPAPSSIPAPVSVVMPPTPPPVIASPKSEAMPAQIKVAVSLEDQQKQEQDIAALAQRSAQLYHQIADIADDSSTVQAKRKMAQVDEILNNLKANKERLLRQMQGEQWKRQQEQSKSKLQEHRAEAEKMYHDGLEYYRSHDYAKAKIQFLQLENLIPDYKSTRRYLSRIDEDLKRSNVEAVTDYEKNQAAHLKQLQDKENIDQLHQVQEEQAKQRSIEEEQQASLKELAQKASNINDDIISLSKTQDYEGMKAKFTELENTVTALTTLKDAMAKQKDRRERGKQLARESANQRANMLRSQRKEDQQIRAYYNVQPEKEYRPVLSNQPSNSDYFKRREIMQEQNTLFSEGVDRYEHKKYTQAKLLFGELADQHDRRAEVWLKKVDRAISQQLMKGEESEARERTAFLVDQLKAQREVIIIQEREHQRQKKLTEELERQKRLYEDDQSLQIRKEQAMKAQERERQRQEAKRLQLERENEKQQQTLRFHKVVVAPQPVAAVVQPAPAPAIAPPSAVQLDFSNKRKAFLDDKYKKEQEEKDRQDKIKTLEDARQKIIVARQQEIDRRKQLRAQGGSDRQARLKAEADARQKLKEEKQKEKEHQVVLEEKHREEIVRQQAEQREETQRRQELERQEREHQAQLEAQREAVRKQLEDGVDAMYQDAMRLYNQGEFTAAADRFKDVQDILPGYKRAGQYMDEARMKSLTVSASSPVSRQENVSKALDLFDPNAK